MEVKEVLAKRIKLARSKTIPPTEANELAHIVGINKSTISRIEAAKLIPSLKTLLLICTALNTDIGKLLSGITLNQEDSVEE